MTKRVRVENADSGTSFWPVVQVWEKSYPTKEDPLAQRPDTLVKEIALRNPADVTDQHDPYLYITDTRYLVVKEGK